MTDKQALNKKLAEWAGFTEIYGRSYSIKYPDGKEGIIPNFPMSLDACFKWLVLPKINWWTMSCGKMGFVIVEVRIYPSISTNYKSGRYEGYVATALALCLAIEKLIDTEEKGD